MDIKRNLTRLFFGVASIALVAGTSLAEAAGVEEVDLVSGEKTKIQFQDDTAYLEDESFAFASDLLVALRLSMVPSFEERLMGQARCYETISDPRSDKTRYVRIKGGTCAEIKQQEVDKKMAEAIAKTDTLKDADIKFKTVDNATVALIYDSERHKVMVTYATTGNAGDIKDSILYSGPIEHKWGGKVHSGFYYDIARQLEDDNAFEAHNMVEWVEAALLDYSSKNPIRPLTVDFSGFCSGAAKSVLTLSDMLRDGFFKDNSHAVKLGDVYAFAAPGYVEKDLDGGLRQRIEEGVRALGGHIWRITHVNDTGADLLTSKGSFFSDKMGYESPGTPVYLVPGKDGNPPQIIIDPTPEEIEALDKIEDGDSFLNHQPAPYERVMMAVENMNKITDASKSAEYEPPNRWVTANMLEGL